MKAARIVLSGFGVGFAPLAPGTVASLAAVLAHWGVFHALGGVAATAVSAGTALAFALATVLWGGAAERAEGRKDPGWVVSDEIAGQLAAVAGLASPWGLGVAFAAFRLLDVTKPFPTGRLERLPGGWGILLDDLLAGAAAAGAVRLAAWLVPGWGLTAL